MKILRFPFVVFLESTNGTSFISHATRQKEQKKIRNEMVLTSGVDLDFVDAVLTDVIVLFSPDVVCFFVEWVDMTVEAAVYDRFDCVNLVVEKGGKK